MKQFHKIFPFLFLGFVACLSLEAQQKFFSDASQSELNGVTGVRTITPEKFRALSADVASLKAFLWSLPSEKNLQDRNLAPVMELPMPNGVSERFRVWESSIQEPGLEAKFPEIKTFLGQGIDDPSATIRFDFTGFGFHAQVLSTKGRVYVDPYARGDVNYYISYYTADNKRATGFHCEPPIVYNAGRPAEAAALVGPCRGIQLTTYRLAVACTGQYAQAVGGTTAALLHSAIVTTVNRVVGVYEQGLTVRMILVANNNIIEYLNPSTDPFNGNNAPGTLINESQTVINSNIGAANYDIGHTFSTGGGGLAGLGVVCNNGQKARGITGLPNPVGDDYDIDFVAHEMGHQFGGNHTFNSSQGNCGGGNRNASTAYEVGSGTTVMGYAGICNADDIQPHSDPYLHSISFDEISTFISGGGSCGVSTPTGNSLPQIVTMSNNGASIPINTPFTLNATATDADGDAITYSWEEWDLGPSTLWANGASSPTAPTFKSRIPKASGARTFPDPAYIAANFLPTTPPAVMNGFRGEKLPTVARTAMKFRLTVRDNRAGGGGIVTGGNGCQTGFTGVFSLGVVGTAPFKVTSPNGGESFAGGSTQTITWNVVGTNAAPVNVANVKISLSTDGGFTYPTVILASTANDGSEAVTIPNSATTTARVKVEAIDNIFFDISDANFTITAAASGFSFSSVAPTSVPCGSATAVATIATTATGGFSTPIVLSATGNPAGTTVSFGTSPLTPGNSSTVTLNGVNTLAPGTYNVTINGVAGTTTQSGTVSFVVQPGTPPSITTQPIAVTACAGGNASFTVVSPAPGVGYQWQVSTGGPFTDIAGATSATYTITGVTTASTGNQYQVVLTTLCGSATSSPALLTVNSATAISAQPADAVVCAGSNNIFSVTAAGSGLSYQWQVSTTGCGGTFTSIAGATSSTFALNGITLAQSGNAYRVVVTGGCAPLNITSSCALLTVSGSVGITTQPVSATVCSGSAANFSIVTSGTGVSYQWQVSNGGPFTDIAGATTSTLSIPAVTSALNGAQYQVVLTNSTCTAPSTSAIATLTVNDVPAITTQPSNVSVCAGSNAVFTAAGSGTGVTYQWQMSTGGPFSDIAGATSATYTVNAATAAMNNNQYQLVVSGTCTPPAVSTSATLSVVSPAGISTQPTIAGPVCEGVDVNLTVTATSGGAATINYVWQVSTDGVTFTNIPGATGASLNLPAVDASLDGNQYQVIVSNGACTATTTSIPVTLTVNTAPVLTASADVSSVCTGNTVNLQATGGTNYTWEPGTLTGANVSVTPTVDPATPTQPNNIVYTVSSTGANGCVGTSTVTVTANPLPVVTLTSNPTNTNILPGQSVVLTASVVPAGTYTYVWEKDGIPITNSGNQLTVSSGAGALYSVTVDDGTGTCIGRSNVVDVRDTVSTQPFFYIYPNPNNGSFTIEYPNEGGLAVGRTITVYDSKGARVYSKLFTISTDPQLINVDLRPVVSSGTYIIVISDSSGKRLATEKVVVQ